MAGADGRLWLAATAILGILAIGSKWNAESKGRGRDALPLAFLSPRWGLPVSYTTVPGAYAPGY